MLKRLRRPLLIALAVVLALAATAALTVTGLVRGSLPSLDGTRDLPGLEAEVTVTRDALGVPDIAAATRADAARALGYLHAQDRFFQMDGQRRAAAGELAALLGPGLLETDRRLRIHQFRHRADQVVAALPAGHRDLLQAYADGVNAGLADLRTRPFEYLLLRRQPEPWRPADSVLTLHSMFLDLALSSATNEAMWSAARDNLPAALTDFLLPRSNPWNAPLQDDPVAGIAVPDSAAVDVRTWTFGEQTWHQFRAEHLGLARHDTAGSNNWAVAGSRTPHGGAILANDMHLSHGLPNIWYRARLSWPDTRTGHRTLVGVTLPGTPAVVVGSNGRMAWGFTNSSGDWADLVILETDPADSTRYRTPDGWRTLERVPEVIPVAGAAPDTLWIDNTIWGPVWRRDSKGRPLALRWTAHDTEAVNFALLDLETADDVDRAVAVGARCGIPAQNLVCADDTGRIAWVLAGRIPRRIGWDGRLSVPWADGTHRWDGYHDPAANPRLVDPADGLLYTANNRVSAGGDLDLIGDGGYSLGWRAGQIRDGLVALGDRADEHGLLAIALDDRALMLEPWRRLALTVVAAAPRDSLRDLFAREVGDHWSGRAEPGSVSYRLMRSVAFNCIDNVYRLLIGSVEQADERFQARWLPYRHAVTWQLIQERPPHLLAPWYADWDHLVLDAVDRAMEYVAATDRPLDEYTWGARNRVIVRHPLVRVAPQLARWLAAPTHGQAGDSFMPRVQHRTSGASERLVVAPGREEHALFHMPGGQSGHPWSPFFLAGHEAWVTGEATPLLPGEIEHRLTLRPAALPR